MKSNNMEQSALATLQAYQQSQGTGTNDWVDLISDDIVFHGPVDRIEGKEAYMKLVGDFGSCLRGVELVQAVESGNTVATQAIYKVHAPTGKDIVLEIGEFYRIEDGKIRSIRIYYDAEEFRREFGR